MKLNNAYFLIRHGQARSNEEKFISSWPEKIKNPLTKKGIEQVKNIIPEIKEEKIDLIFSSDLLRTKQTAEMIATDLGLSIVFDERLREIDTGALNGKTEKEWNSLFDNPMDRFVKRPTDGENYRDIKKRTEEFLKEVELKNQGKKIIVVSHGAILFVFAAIVLDYTEEQEMANRKNLILKNAEIKKIN